MLRRKLQALGYPHAETFEAKSDGQMRNLVVWLEDTKICKYRIEDRSALREVDGPKWAAAFTKYLEDLECPREGSVENQEARYELLDWLVGYAVSLEYSDNAATYGGRVTGTAKEAIDGTAEFELTDESLKELAHLLQLPPHGDSAILLKAVTNTLITKFRPAAVATALAAKDELRREIPLEHTPLGFDTGDGGLDKACKVLRLLHIADLRDLQTRINELIVAVQSLTADPKTNSHLGKVGK